MVYHTNSEGEKIGIELAKLNGQSVLILTIFDDPPPRGTGQRAPMLLDEGLKEWLLYQLPRMEIKAEKDK
jgi:hypothetical protein